MNDHEGKDFKLKLVKNGLSSVILFFTFMSLLLTPIILITVIQGMSKTTLYAILIPDLLLFFLLVWKYFDKLLVKYESSLIFHSDTFELDGKQYNWEEIEWYRRNSGSKFTMGFVVGLKSQTVLKFYVTTKEGEELNTWMEMVDAFEKAITQKSIQTKNYYNTRGWRRFARILLLSNLVLPLLSIGLGFHSNTILGISIAWLFISLPFPIIIFTIQEKN